MGKPHSLPTPAESAMAPIDFQPQMLETLKAHAVYGVNLRYAKAILGEHANDAGVAAE
jgi:hypothetical protein